MSESFPLISVIIPVYNAAPYLKKCLESVLSSTLKEIEVICVDDGSTDRSPDILREAACTDARLRVVTQPHQSVGEARNAGLEAAAGKYIHFLDADDWIDPSAYEKWYALAEESGAEVTVCLHTNVDLATGNILKGGDESMHGHPEYSYETSFREDPAFLISSSAVVWNKLYLRSFLLRHDLRFSSLPAAEDRVFYFQLLRRAGRILTVREKWIFHTLNNPASIDGGTTRFTRFDVEFRSFETIMEETNRSISGLNKRFQELLLVLTCFVFGLAAHGYAWFNRFFSHDSMETWFGPASDRFVAQLGRYLHGVFHFARGAYNPPALTGFLSLAFLTAACLLLIRLFRIRDLLFRILLCMFLISYNALTLTYATYMHDADIYMLSLLCAVLAVYALRKGGRAVFAAPFFIFLVCGLYQSYLFTALGLLLFLAMRDLLEERSVRSVLREGVKELLLCGAGLAVYAAGLLILRSSGVIPFEDMGNSVTRITSLLTADFPKLIGKTYLFWAQKMLCPASFHPRFTGCLNLLLTAAALLLMVRQAAEKKLSRRKSIFLLILTALIPLALNGIYVLTSGAVHDLMTYQFCLIYVFILWIFDSSFTVAKKIPQGKPAKGTAAETKLQPRQIRAARCAAAFLCCVILWNAAVYSNNVYLKKDLEYQKTAAVMNRIMDRIEETPGYEAGKTPVAVIGLLMHSDYFRNRYPDLPYDGTGIAYGSAVTYYETYSWYLNNQLGYGINILPLEESTRIGADEAVRSMNCFPSDGCTKIENGVLIVKVSDKWWNQPI